MMQPIRMRTAIEMRLFTSGKASSSSPVLVLKVPIIVNINLTEKDGPILRFPIIFIICILCRLDMVEIEGKRGRELPLLLMPDIKEAMEILVKKRRSQHQSKQQVFLYPPV